MIRLYRSNLLLWGRSAVIRLASAVSFAMRAVCIAIAFSGAASAADAQIAVPNHSFEDADTSGKLLKWSSEVDAGTRLQDCDVKHDGRCSLHLVPAHLGGRAFVAVTQTLLAAGIDGKAVRLSGWIKVSGHISGLASLWIRVDAPGGPEKLDNMASRAPKGTSDWQRFEAEVPLTTNSRIITFGALFGGVGEAWFDDLKIEIVPGQRAESIVHPAPAEVVHGPALPSPYPVVGTQPITWSPQFEDLGFLKALLQQKRIVALGESAHGVAQFSAIKVRLVKFLHEQLGYNLIAFESPMTGCADADTMIGNATPEQVMKRCLFPVWHSREMLELFEYIISARAAGRDLRISGFDIQDSSLQPWAMDELKGLLEVGHAGLFFRLERAETTLRRVRARRADPTDALELDSVYRTVAGILNNVEQHKNSIDPGKLAFLRMQMLSRIALVTVSDAPLGSRKSVETRDSAMAANFDYLMHTRYPSRKVIVWGHNAHVAKQWPEPQEPRVMGSQLARTYGKSMYVVGLVMGKGVAATNTRKPYSVGPPDPKSLEGAFAGAGVSMGFLDFTSNKAGWMSGPVITRDWGRQPIIITPDLSFDGLIYIDTVSPPEYM